MSKIFPNFKLMMEKYFNLPIVIGYFDGGGEYEAFKQTFLTLRVQHLVSPLHTPQLINTVECRHRHIVEIGLTLLHQASLLFSLWTFAFQITTYLINYLPSPIFQFLSPFEKLFSQSPNYLKLHVFGCLCYPYFHPYTKRKLTLISKLFVRRVARNILSNVILPHATLIAEEEHIINLFMVIFL